MLEELIKKYDYIHPLIVKRTLENTKNLKESIYILENLPSYPICWSEEKRKWVKCNAAINKTK